MRGETFLKLGRVSNLPTVWTNVLAGVTLAGGAIDAKRLGALLLSCSLFYTGGMFLNDAFDSEFDAKNRPERPIPTSRAHVSHVFAAGYGMLSAALIILVLLRGSNWGTPACGLLLAFVIIYYDAHHKRNPLSPALMGLCRALIYAVCALAVSGRVGLPTALGGLALFLYVIALSAVAKNEDLLQRLNFWPRAFPNAIAVLIAGISLLDALIIAGHGSTLYFIFALLGFTLTLFLQRYVAGT